MCNLFVWNIFTQQNRKNKVSEEVRELLKGERKTNKRQKDQKKRRTKFILLDFSSYYGEG